MKLETKVESFGIGITALEGRTNASAQHLGLRQPAAAFRRQPCCRRVRAGVRRQQGWLEKAAAGLRAVQGAARICGVAFVSIIGSVFAADDSPHHLIWRDGSSLDGRITSATVQEITIKSPDFAVPLVVDSAVLGEVQFARGAEPQHEPFLFSLKDGTAITGSIAGITDKEVTAHNATLGDFVIPAIELLSIQRVSEADLAPPLEPATPTLSSNSASIVFNNLQPAKAKAADSAGTLHATKLSERCDIVLKMRTQPKPVFRVVVTGTNNRKVTIEAKDGDLILQGRIFVLIKNITAVDGAVNLHLYWNQRSGQCALCTSAGECLGETNKGPVGDFVPGDSQGVRIEQSVPTFAISFLGVNSWDGIVPRGHELEGPGVMLTDESAIKGRVVTADGKSIGVRSADGRVIPVPMENLFRVRFDPARGTPSRLAPVALWFADGTTLEGRLTSIRDGAAEFETPRARTPVHFKLDALRQMVFRSDNDEKQTAPAASKESLRIGDHILSGSLGDDADGVSWKPPGARGAVMLAKGVEFSITRETGSAPVDGAVFHLSDGEVLSGSLIAMDEKELEAKWSYGTAFKLTVAMVRAIQFASDRVSITGFDDEGWAPVAEKGSAVSLKKNEAALSGIATLEHPDAMRASDIRFTWQPTGSYCDLELSLFQSGGDDGKMSGVKLRLNCAQNKVRALMLEQDASNVTKEIGSAFIEMSKPMAVRLEVTDSSVVMWINDKARMLIPVIEERHTGSGLAFGVKQSGAVIINNAAANGARFMLRLSNNTEPTRIWNFSATTSAGHLRPASGVNRASRREALLIPRFRKDVPPKQVIVATNHDVLRGDVLAVAAEHLLFRTGLETVRVPLSRIAAIVTPLPVMKDDGAVENKPDGPNALLPVDGSDGAEGKNANGDTSEPVTYVSLNSGGRVGLKLEAIRDGVITGTHPLIGACKIPLALVTGIENRAVKSLIASHALDAWRWEFAPETVLPETGGESSLALGNDAALFKLPLLGGGDFDLAQERGKVIVLDFWATWCGPCVKSLPGLIEAMSAFPPGKVRFIGVNQGEGGETVKRFLETRKLKLTVAMDGAQAIARQYGVDGIPHTIVIGPDGKIGWVKTGYSSEGAKAAAAAVTRMLTK